MSSQSSETEFDTGEWYYMIACKKCKTRQPLFHDLNRGQSLATVIYVWTCQVCGHEDRYEPEEVERYRHPGRQEPKKEQR